MDPGLYSRSFEDVYDSWYRTLDDPADLVDAFVLGVPRPARIVELGGGTGRLANPLHDAGFDVISVDVSPAMLRRAAHGPARVGCDMIRLCLADRSADAVLIAYNTLFNLTSRVDQQTCMTEVARVLRPGGLLAIEAFVAPATHQNRFGISIRDHPTRAGARLAIVTGPSSTDDELIIGSHVELGQPTVCRPWSLCYRSPADLDAAAGSADLRLVRRHSDWAGAGFDDDSVRHVSWYERGRSAVP